MNTPSLEKLLFITRSQLAQSTDRASISFFLQARVEPFSTEVQLRPPEPEGPRRACALPAKERFLFQEGGTGGEGPQGARAVVRGGQVQHAHIPLSLRDLRLHHAGWNPGWLQN